MKIYNTIKRPVVTEKSQKLELSGVYTVIVDPSATKVDIKNSFKRLYGVTVEAVNIIKTREKFRNTRTGASLKRKMETKALVSLKGKERISDFAKIKD
ncbi:50S ribosomal protein L23 [Candidatus Gracilibacteria bacterium]|nr:50S ribosomal protein L23 [Candidatus Gracilibacteria bacterium]